MGLVSLTDAINTTSAQGWLVFNLFASLAEFERELIRERSRFGTENLFSNQSTIKGTFVTDNLYFAP